MARTTAKKEVTRGEFPDRLDQLASEHGLDVASRRRLRDACIDMATAYEVPVEEAERVVVEAARSLKRDATP